METEYLNPKTSGFSWHITKPSFSNSIDENPLYTPDLNDPDTLIQNQIRIFEDEISAYDEDPLAPLAGQGAPVHIGIDCEYQHLDGTLTNTILSYQFCLYSPAGVLMGIVYPTSTNTKVRIDFNIFLGTIIHTAMRDDLIEEWPKVAYVYAHFMRADITHFSEFWKRKNEFDGLRGTIASIKTPYESDYSSEKTRYIKPSPLMHILTQSEHPFWINLNTYSDSS